MKTPLIVPPRLAAGDRVALISPASPLKDRPLLRLGKARLEQLGLEVVLGRHVMAQRGYLAGSDDGRRQDLEAAFRDPDIKAVFCARGGYGAARVLAGFDPALARRHPKALVGFSDITVMHLALQKAGVVSFWGPMPCTGLGWSAFSVRGLERMLMSASPAGRLPIPRGRRPRALRAGRAEGPLTGGTLSMIASSLGTPYEIETRGRIVFMEDVGEEPYRVDRMLVQLIAAGKLSDAAGFAVGSFTGADARNCPAKKSLTMKQVFADHLVPLKRPILANVAVGHVPDQVTLPYGLTARIDAGAGTLEILQSGVR
jgi:muramoyltetrapeptide carboxypeptidase